MEIPIYYNFVDFKNDYQDNFKKWNEFFPDARECDFTDELIKTYQVALKNVTFIEVQEMEIVDTVSRFTGIDIIDEIECKVYDKDSKEFDLKFIKNCDFTFSRIIEFLLKRLESVQLDVPTYFNFESFKKDYLLDFKKLKVIDNGLTLHYYYYNLTRKYFDIHRENSKIKETDENKIKRLSKFFDQYEFIIFLLYLFGKEYESFLKKHPELKENEVLRILLTKHISTVEFAIMETSGEIHGFLLNKLIESESNFETEQSRPLTPPELDFSNNSDKEKLIILEKLGIINYIKTIQTKPETILHTSEILSAITGIESKTLNTYLYPMLRPRPDNTDPNSPYKNPDNLLNAEKAIHKLKIKNIDANR